MSGLVRRFVGSGAALLALTALGRAGAAEVGQVLDDVRLAAVDGSAPAPLVDRSSKATVAIFFRPDQERSTDTLKVLAKCAGLLPAGVRIVGVVSGTVPPEEVRQALQASGATLPVLRDEGDAIYARAGIRLHPAILVVDRERRIAAFEPYHQVDLCEIVTARVRRAVGEIDDAAVAKAIAPPDSKLPGASPLGVAHRYVSFGRKLLDGSAYRQAHENARKSLAIAPSAAAWALEGDVFLAEGNCADARRSYASALALDPRDAAALAGQERCPP